MIRVTCPNVLGGPVVKMFICQKQAFEFVSICIDNKVYCEIEILN